MEYDKLLDLTKCLICNEPYEDPIILPCHSTICSRHLLIQAVSSECIVCKKEHAESSTGFKSDVKAVEMVTTITQFVDHIELGLNNREARKECDFLEKEVKEAESLVADPLGFVDDYFGKLKSHIDLTKERFIQMISENHQEVIAKVNIIQRECKMKAEGKLTQLDANCTEKRQDLKKWKKSLKTVDFNLNEHWKGLVHKVHHERTVIKTLVEKAQNDLLLNKNYSLQPHQVEDRNNFGVLVLEEISGV